jgi:hypothetical protein
MHNAPSASLPSAAVCLSIILLAACAPAPTATPTLNPGATHTRPTDGAETGYVPTGEFLMGSTAADGIAANDEKSQHTVYLDAFWINGTEVTSAGRLSSLVTLSVDATKGSADPGDQRPPSVVRCHHHPHPQYPIPTRSLANSLIRSLCAAS